MAWLRDPITHLHRATAAWGSLQAAGRRLTVAVIRKSIHFAPTEAQRTFGVTLLAGATSGVLAVLFHLAIHLASSLLIERAQQAPGYTWLPLTLLVPTLGGLLAGVILVAFPQARGSGVPKIKATYAGHAARLRLRDGVAKFFVTVLQLGTGAALGREGPTVQICAAASSALGRWFALSPRSVRRMLPVGAAAGVAAAFNAPVAAVTFTVEEIVGGLDQTVLSGVVVAAALAAVIEHTILGKNPIFTLTSDVGLSDPRSLLLYALLGLLAGLVSVGFSRGLLGLRKWFLATPRLPIWAGPAVGGLVTGGCAAVGLWAVNSRGVAGGGYAQLNEALNGNFALTTLLVLGGLKFVATLFSYASGGSGGLFAPALFIGAMLGGAVGWLDSRAFGVHEIGAFALVGMGASFAGIIRAPITSVLIVFEMTAGYGLVLPLMIANTTAYVVARRFDSTSLYDALLEQDGIRLLHAPSGAARLEGLRVEDAMTSRVHSLNADMSAAQALAELDLDAFVSYPVVDAHSHCGGVITRARIQRINAEGQGKTRLGDTVRLKEYVYPEDPLLRAVVRMHAVGTRQLPVVSRDGKRLVGLIAMSDIFHAQAKAADEPETASHSSLPPSPDFGEVSRSGSE